jgi:hypothetical protein
MRIYIYIHIYIYIVIYKYQYLNFLITSKKIRKNTEKKFCLYSLELEFHPNTEQESQSRPSVLLFPAFVEG